MKPRFKLDLMVTEAAFLRLEKRVRLPDEQTLAIEIAAKRKISLDDVRVNYPLVKETKHVLVALREKQEINCRQDAHWIFYARECLNKKLEFDLIGATETEINKFDSEAKKHANFSRPSESKQRHKFRLIQQTGD
jgi:hypothetical protein